MATLRQLIDAAYSRSTFNDPDKLATDRELAAVIDRRFKEMFSIAAGINPYYFGKRSTVEGVAGEWSRPVDAEMIARVEMADGTEVTVVPFEDKEAELPPCVYAFGRKYYKTPESTALPDTATLTFFYSKSPATMSTAADELDADWPEQFNDLIVLHVARYLAVKDQRVEEVQLFDAELASLLQSFQRHLMHENYAMVARWGHRARLVSQGPVSYRNEGA